MVVVKSPRRNVGHLPPSNPPWSYTTAGKQTVISPVFQQIKVTCDKKRMDHVVPAETLQDRLGWAGLEVIGGGTGQIKRQQSETWRSRKNTDTILKRHNTCKRLSLIFFFILKISYPAPELLILNIHFDGSSPSNSFLLRLPLCAPPHPLQLLTCSSISQQCWRGLGEAQAAQEGVEVSPQGCGDR